MALFHRLRIPALATAAMMLPASALAHESGQPHVHPHGILPVELLVLIGGALALAMAAWMLRHYRRVD